MSSNDQANDEQSNDYASRPGQNEYGVPVVKDDAAVEEGGYTGEAADSDAQLGTSKVSYHHYDLMLTTAIEKDDKDVDQSNIIEGGRTRGAAKEQGSYTEPGDEEGLPSDDGTSRGR